MVAVENKKQVIQKDITFENRSENKGGFYKTYNPSTPVQKSDIQKKISALSALVLMGILITTTVLSFDNPVFFRAPLLTAS